MLLAVAEGDTAVGHGGELGVVGYDDEGLAVLVAEGEEELVELAGVLGVEVAAGLVGQDGHGAVHQCAGDGDALLLAAAEGGGLVGGAVVDLEFLQQLAGAGFGLTEGGAGDEGWDADVLQGGEFGQEVVGLEDEADVLVAEACEVFLFEAADVGVAVAEGAGVGTVEGAEDLEEGGLAGAGGADDGDHLAPGYLERDVAQDLQGAIAFVEVEGLDHISTPFKNTRSTLFSP